MKRFISFICAMGFAAGVNAADIGLLSNDCTNQNAEDASISSVLDSKSLLFDCLDPTIITENPDLSMYTLLYSRTGSNAYILDNSVMNAIGVAVQGGTNMVLEFQGFKLAQKLGLGESRFTAQGFSPNDTKDEMYFVEAFSDNPILRDLPQWPAQEIQAGNNPDQLVHLYSNLETLREQYHFLFNDGDDVTSYSFWGLSDKGSVSYYETNSEWCNDNPETCTSKRSVIPQGNNDRMGTVRFWGTTYASVQHGQGTVYFSGVANTYSDWVTIGPVGEQIRRNFIDEAIPTVVKEEKALVTVLLAKEMLEPDAEYAPEIYGEVKLTYGQTGGQTQEFLCTEVSSDEEGICDVEIPIGDLVVLERFNEGAHDIQCSVDGTVIPNLGAFTVEQDTTLSCKKLSDEVTVKFRFPQHKNGVTGEIRTEVTHGSEVSTCRTTGRPRNCEFVLNVGDHFSISKVAGNASYSIPGRAKNLEEDVDLEISEDTEIFVSNGEVVVTVHGFSGSNSSELVCGIQSGIERLANVPLLGLTVEALNTGEWIVVESAYGSMRDYVRKSGFQVVEANYDWRRDVFDNARWLDSFVYNTKLDRGKTTLNFVAHSMGGLVVRTYAQSNFYQNDIDRFVMMGSPHMGSAKAVKAYHGGNYENGVFLSSATIAEKYLEIQMDSCAPGEEDDYVYIRNVMPSMQDLLPAYPYYVYGTIDAITGTPAPLDDMCVRNYFLEELNANAGILNERNIKMLIVASQNKSTIEKYAHHKNPPSYKDCDLSKKWPDRKPKGKYTPTNGDGTVSIGSSYPAAYIPAFEGVPLLLVKGKHSKLPGKRDVQKGVVAFLREN